MGQDVLPTNKYLKQLPLSQFQQVAVSPQQAAVFAKNTNRQAAVIPWGVHPIPNNTTAKKIDLLGAGNLTALKDYSTFIAVVEKLLPSFPEIKAEIAGDGPEKEAIRTLIREKGLGNNITLLGHLGREEVLEKMAESKVFLHPSQYESFGLVFSEARSLGIPIVSKQVGQAEESPSWKIGTDSTALASHCAAFLEDESTVHPKNQNGLEECVTKYLSLYQQMIR